MKRVGKLTKILLSICKILFRRKFMNQSPGLAELCASMCITFTVSTDDVCEYSINTKETKSKDRSKKNSGNCSSGSDDDGNDEEEEDHSVQLPQNPKQSRERLQRSSKLEANNKIAKLANENLVGCQNFE